ncbi:hypothetical protein HYPSUDRAFT_224256 [Hypholoma sublateritium FD-334 SS-4]|uniref:Uncharacterized protein n=1 Tax=Hypholoma sublateritium (strain FD-334 SS-4) TaxID=945553 RepID=A0A0D2PFS8_HYPSF|nr:hypothetical protein HYPSUDRAFT_224256 [Hypholoma sublateritium FD-334 SS-4]
MMNTTATASPREQSFTDEFGKDITPVPNYPHFVGKPDAFPCVVSVRDATAARLIEEARFIQQ